MLRRRLLKHRYGDRATAWVLPWIPLHGLDRVPVAVECAPQSERSSGERVMNVSGRIKELVTDQDIMAMPMGLNEEPVANVAPSGRQRVITPETNDVA